MSKAFCQVIIITTLLMACAEDNSKKEDENSTASDRFRSYNLSIDEATNDIEDLFESVRIVRLEETENSLLAGAYGAKYFDGEYAIPGDNGQSIQFFDDEGNYLSKFNHHGGGPEEYKDIRNFWLEGDSVFIFSAQSKKLLTYNKQGDFIESQSIPYTTDYFAKLGDQYFLDVSPSPVKDSLTYYLASFNLKFEETGFYLPYDLEVQQPMRVINSHNLTPHRDLLVYNYVKNDTVYKVTRSGAEPFFHLNFDQGFFWNSEMAKSDPNRAIKELNDPNSNKVWIYTPIVGDSFIYLRFNTSYQTSYRAIINRQTGETRLLDLRNNQEERFGLVALNWYNNEMLMVVGSSALRELIGKLELSQISFKEGSSLDVIESSENPVLMWVNFKDSF